MSPPARRGLLVVAHSPAARGRADRLFAERPDTTLAGPVGAWRAASALARARPGAAYLIDIGASTAAAAAAARTLRVPLVIDTGDLVFELERSRGSRSALGLAAVWAGERFMLRAANHVVVRGTEHLALLGERPATYAPDLAPAGARPVSGDAVRSRLGLEGSFVVGLVGALHRAPRLGISYGWDLVEALAGTPPEVSALVVGDGAARPELEARAAALGVAGRCRFVGAVPETEVAELVGAMDAAISTQTNDRVGAVRTTGKLPLYVACGCPVLASNVGEARRLLGPLGWTIPYEGVVDRGYPARLAAAVVRWLQDPAGAASRREQALELSRKAFDPETVRGRVNAVIDELMATRRS